MSKSTFFLLKTYTAWFPSHVSNVPFLYSKTPDNWWSNQNSLSSSLTLKQLSLVYKCGTLHETKNLICCHNYDRDTVSYTRSWWYWRSCFVCKTVIWSRVYFLFVPVKFSSFSFSVSCSGIWEQFGYDGRSYFNVSFCSAARE